MSKTKTPFLFLITAGFSLIVALTFGILAAIQYLKPDFLKSALPFSNIRPMHVTAAVSWIILAATGGIYYYLQSEMRLKNLYLPLLHFIIFAGTGICIYVCYSLGIFGGKEYLEFPPLLIIPILAGWVLFAYNVIVSLIKHLDRSPVYYRMWMTGGLFMLYHLSEAYIWLAPGFREKFITVTVLQWKAGGSFVGSWNMLVYGTATFIMAKITPGENIGTDRKSHFFYFLGLINLMFGWAHHVYLIPFAPWVRYVAYVISMSEWVLFFNIIYGWRKSIAEKSIFKDMTSIRFLAAADKWILGNLLLALIISIPAVNYYTHGTHITVAHSMGATIGINTSILFASLTFIAEKENRNMSFKTVHRGLKLFNFMLMLFLAALLSAGISRSAWMHSLQPAAFAVMQEKLYIVYLFLLMAGLGLTVSVLMMLLPVMNTLIKSLLQKQDHSFSPKERQHITVEAELRV